MRFPPLLAGRLLRRYKRFLADVLLADGRRVTAHTNNTGAMTGCARPGSAVRLSRAEGRRRKLPYTWELARDGRSWVMINTLRANRLAEEAIVRGVVGELRGYPTLRREVPCGEGSRIDLMLEGPRGRALVEVKNATLARDGTALFPDAATERGRKHLRALAASRGRGTRSIILFCVARSDCTRFAPAASVDPDYAELLRDVASRGVEPLAYACRVGPSGAALVRGIPVDL